MTDDTPDGLDGRISTLEADFKGLLQQHQQALERIAELEATVQEYADDRERLVFRVGKLEECLPDERDEYDTYTREDKVSLLKSHLLERAYARDGKASADYDDVIWGVFDGEPSRDHAYTLMELAAQADGFHYNTSRRPREVRVDLDETKAEVDLSHATTNEQRGGD
jgi:cell division septum initiation protein DivIVA